MLIERLTQDLIIDPDLPPRDKIGNEPLDLDALNALKDFSIVPYDYLVMYVYYGQVGFTSLSRNFSINLRHPFESHEFYFDDGRSDLMPNMFPMTSASGPFTLYYGEINKKLGVYVAWDSSCWPDMSEYVADSLSDILFLGIGLDVIAKY